MNNMRFTDEELYNIMADAYKLKYGKTYDKLHKALKAMLKVLPEDCVIYILMQEMNALHAQKKDAGEASS